MSHPLILSTAFLLALAVSAAGVRQFVLWARRRNVLDIPNERSSHERPTPKGGGWVIVAAGLLCLIAFALVLRDLSLAGYAAILLAISAVSWWDDLRPLSSLGRLAVHLAAALLIVLLFGPLPAVILPGGSPIPLGPFGYVAAVVWIVGLTNAYNFMDGIDGLAGLQAAIVAAGWLSFGFAAGSDFLLWFSLLLLAASLGFLAHNWPPAAVFMGDVGSAYLGFVIASLPLVIAPTGGRFGQLDAAYFVIITSFLIWPFLFDTSLTFLRRLLRGENVLAAHRSHFYQRLVISGLSHQRVTLLYGSLSICGLGLAWLYWLDVPFILYLALISMALLAAVLWGLVRYVEAAVRPVRRPAPLPSESK